MYFFICNLYINIYIYNYIQYHFTQVHWTLFLPFDQNVNKQEKTFNLKENTHTQVFADRKCLYKVRWSSWIQVQKLYTASDCHLVADEVIYCRMKQQETFEVFMYYTKNIINAGSFTLLCVNISLYLNVFKSHFFYLSCVSSFRSPRLRGGCVSQATLGNVLSCSVVFWIHTHAL